MAGPEAEAAGGGSGRSLVEEPGGPEVGVGEERVPGSRERDNGPEKKPEGAAVEPLLVNKARPLPADYVPPDLRPAGIPFTCPVDSPKRLLRAEAAEALERLFARATQEGIALLGVSGYRSYERQREIFAAHMADLGEEAANRVSARPGESEHQTGLAIDVSSPEVGGLLVESFGETEAGRWLAQNAPKYGFVIRYPRGKEDVTGYAYEPWHLRYVGTEHALAMAERNLTLEEYLAGRAG
ncbi:MAG: M15 family metallopeptidase [Firmicutes bacterium]|nr:M15 family metallopeptidase [Bacillota bacterium]